MPNEYRTVRVIVSSGVQLSEADLREELSQYGQVEKVRLCTRGGSDNVWGTVTFRLPEQAELAVNLGFRGGKFLYYRLTLVCNQDSEVNLPCISLTLLNQVTVLIGLILFVNFFYFTFLPLLL